MTLKGFGWFVIVLVAGAGAAWYSAENELLGANPVWIESSARYAPRPVFTFGQGEGETVEEGEESLPGPVAEMPGEPKAPVKEGGGGLEEEKEASGPVAPGAKTDSPKPAGLDAFLRTNVKDYEVQPGDSLSRIGNAHAVPYTLIARLNGIEGSSIAAGSILKVIQGPFHVRVFRNRKILRLWRGDVQVKEYPVAVGKPGFETVLGSFHVRTKMVEPPWTDPDTRELVPFGTLKNPLGTRWIGFADGLGIHGTWEPESVGHAASRGCIRMRNPDVEELFNFLVRRESKVEIVDDMEPEAGEEIPGEEGETKKMGASATVGDAAGR